MLAIYTYVQADGPDIVVAALTDIARWTRIDGTTAYSIGTIACNHGTAPIQWNGSSNQHPVIAQNLYRLRDGRFEQIGASWIKHGFAAETEDYCMPCESPGSAFLLGVGCSDAYRSQLNGQQQRLTPRSSINPATGGFQFPIDQDPAASELDRRIQVRDEDLIAIPGMDSFYFAEAIYVSADDAAAGNNMNNATFRAVLVTESPPESRDFSLLPVGPITVGRTGLDAWSDMDDTVVALKIDLPGDGRIQLAATATYQNNGFWRYEYAIYNYNSDRGIGGFRVQLPVDGVVGMTRFHDVNTHSGENISSLDWPAARTARGLVWATTAYEANPAANSIRWGTMYNFTLDVNASPVMDCPVQLTVFKPGSPDSIALPFLGPSAESPDCNENGVSDAKEVSGGSQRDCNANGLIDECEMASCPGIMAGDFDCDNAITINDADGFVAALLSGSAPCLTDLNSDGARDGRDIVSFVRATLHR